jgi:signal transduction histidine kinase
MERDLSGAEVTGESRSLSLLRATLEATADGILVVSLERIVSAYNRRFVELWRIPEEILASHDDQRLIASVLDQLLDPDEFRARIDDLYRSTEAESFDRLRLRDGRVFERYSRPQWVSGVPAGRVWSFRDVTDRVRAERELARRMAVSEELTRVGMAAASGGLAEVARLAIAAACRSTGWAAGLLLRREGARGLPAPSYSATAGAADALLALAAELGGATLAERAASSRSWEWAADLAAAHDPLATAALACGFIAGGAFPIIVGGEVTAILQFFSHTPDAPDELSQRQLFALSRILASVLERENFAAERERLLTTAEEARARAEEAVRVRDELLAIASHELKTPVSALQVALQGVMRVAERQTRRLTRLVDTLLDVSRIAAGHLSLVPEEIDLAQLAAEVVDQVRSALEKPVDVTVCGPHVQGTWDRARLEEVVSNLVSNALKYGDGRPVEVSIEDRQGSARLAVTDHGTGIAPEHLRTIFDRFERGGARSETGGLGLGLYIVRRLVEAHGGSVHVESTVGRGSIFTVDLPCRPP